MLSWMRESLTKNDKFTDWYYNLFPCLWLVKLCPFFLGVGYHCNLHGCCTLRRGIKFQLRAGRMLFRLINITIGTWKPRWYNCASVYNLFQPPLATIVDAFTSNLASRKKKMNHMTEKSGHALSIVCGVWLTTVNMLNSIATVLAAESCFGENLIPTNLNLNCRLAFPLANQLQRKIICPQVKEELNSARMDFPEADF